MTDTTKQPDPRNKNHWNHWRRDNPGVMPDLRGADLHVADLSEAKIFPGFVLVKKEEA